MQTKETPKKAAPQAAARSNALQRPLQPSDELAAVVGAEDRCPGARW